METEQESSFNEAMPVSPNTTSYQYTANCGYRRLDFLSMCVLSLFMKSVMGYIVP